MVTFDYNRFIIEKRIVMYVKNTDCIYIRNTGINSNVRVFILKVQSYLQTSLKKKKKYIRPRGIDR